MKIICAWCKKSQGEKPPYNDDRVTHSICAPCRDAELKNIRLIKAIRLGIYVIDKNSVDNLF